jgi:hypothetical protein
MFANPDVDPHIRTLAPDRQSFMPEKSNLHRQARCARHKNPWATLALTKISPLRTADEAAGDLETSALEIISAPTTPGIH